MIKVIPHFPEYQFVLAGVKNIPDELYNKIIGNAPVKLIKEKTYEILVCFQAALVTSGTATLEAALLGTPQVVCYKGDFFSMLIAWMVIKVKYISLVNLIMDSEVIKELVQYDLKEKNLINELKAILPGGEKREKILSDYEALKDKLGPAGASMRIAEEMVREMMGRMVKRRMGEALEDGNKMKGNYYILSDSPSHSGEGDRGGEVKRRTGDCNITHDDRFMLKFKILFIFFIIVGETLAWSQVKIRLFSDQSPESAVFSVTEGKYEINTFTGEPVRITKGEPVIISKFKERLVVKSRVETGVICDSVHLKGTTGKDIFSLRIDGNFPVRQLYSGDFMCFPDMETLVLINIADIEEYIAGVVKSEGGTGRNIEYYKTQAVIARTYLYKYFDKHTPDRYNVCDDTHCQAFKGNSSDTIINRAALETKDLVILDKDSTLIVAAFHSNCGGETAPPEDVWLTGQSYLKRVTDPYCLTSRNASWVKIIKREDWIAYLKRSGYADDKDIPASFSFIQNSRLTDYKTETVSIPLRNIRTDLNLSSTFFSVTENNSSIILKGRGYGHGVGLCQEGAMAMASQGFRFNQIIDFYYSGVMITDIKNAVILPPE